MVKKQPKKFANDRQQNEDLESEPLLNSFNEGGAKDLADDKSKKNDKEEEESESDGYGDDYVEKRKFCCCFTMKCGVIFMGILLLLDFLFEIY